MTGNLRQRQFAVILLALLLTSAPTISPVAAQSAPGRIFAWVESVQAPEEIPIRWPVAVASSPAGEIAIADAFGQRLLLFKPVGVSWELERTVTLSATPAGLGHDGTRFVVALRGGHGLAVVDDGEPSPRRLPLPDGVVPGVIGNATKGRLLVADVATRSVLLLSSEGETLQKVAVDGHITGLAAGNQGGFFATLADPPVVLRYDREGSLQSTWEIPGLEPREAWPAGIAVDSAGDVVVSDRHGGRILVFDASGRWIGQGSRKGWEPGLLRYPGSLARLPDGGLLVADQGNARVQIFRRTDRGGG